MAFRFASKKEKTMGATFTLKNRVEYIIDPMSGEMRLTTEKDKGGRFLLGVTGQQVDMIVALKLGLIKIEPEKAEIKDEDQPKAEVKPRKKPKAEDKE